MNNLIISITDQLKDIQNGKLWMGDNFMKKLGTLDPYEVFNRPLANLHSVAEIISHLTCWRKETILKIKTGKGSITDDAPENWLDNSVLQKLGWEQILKEHQETSSELIELLSTKEDDFLKEKYYDTDFAGDYTYSFVIYGMIHHDLYHLGQLGLIIKFIKEKGTN